MPDHRYLFVDGAYLRARHAEALNSVFGDTADLHLADLRTIFPGRIQRVYYYDSLHDIPKAGETEEQLKARVEAQQKFFDEVQSYEGFHVRLGSLSGTSRRFRQKEVDILLAVDALDHAFRRNMSEVTLLAGDLDFAPLVEALVQLGVWVEIWYDPRSVGKRLLEVADKRIPIQFHDYYNRSTQAFRTSHPLPTHTQDVPAHVEAIPGYVLLKTGNSGTQGVRLFRHENEHLLVVDGATPWLLSHADAAVLENYFNAVHGQLVWPEAV